MRPRAELLAVLACPRDHGELHAEDARLRCSLGHTFPVVDGVPVMLLEEATPTIGIARDSMQRARDPQHADPRAPELYLESVGISEREKEGVVALHAHGGAVDPVAAYLVGATNGLMYVPLIGRMTGYPIPELRLAPGGGKRLLDVGCGWGRWSIAAARKGYRTLGIDPSLGAVMAARRVSRQLGLEIDFVVGDARFLPVRSRSVDVAFSYSVLQHFAEHDTRAALREIGRVLVPGGTSLVQMANFAGVRSLQHQLRRGLRAAQGFEVRYWSVPALRAAFEREIGASEIEVDGFFGLGMQPSDAALLPPLRRSVLAASTAITALSRRLTPLRWLADSVYVRSRGR